MEKLKVSNFLTLEEIELEIKPINIVIGEQAQGKSILAKLIYFFKSFLGFYKDSIAKEQSEEEFKLQLEKIFTEIFPKYSWKEDNFSLLYKTNSYQITVNNSFSLNKQNNLETTKNKTSTSLKFKYSDILLKIRKDFLNILEQNTISSESSIDDPISLFFNNISLTENQYDLKSTEKRKENHVRYVNYPVVQDLIRNTGFQPEDIQKEEVSFIPAGRSFFFSIENNIFYILLKGINIDRFIKEFGSLYERFKKYYLQMDFEQSHSENQKVKELVNAIIGGEYIRENGLDMIQSAYGNRQRKINISNASSGQQESLPILIILSALSIIEKRFFLVIEEPEAHLFPEAQKHMVELMSLIFNTTEKKNKLFITTHSPYLLTAFNHCIQAGNILRAINNKPPEEAEKLREKLFEITPQNHIIDIEDIGVYTLINGKIKDIIDPNNHLIDTNIIDEVSELFGEEFDELLDLESKVCQWR